MTFFERLTAGAAWIALLLSGVALYWNREVSRAQLTRWKAEEDEAAKANLDLRTETTRTDSNGAIVVENIGRVEAFQVTLDLNLEPTDDNIVFIPKAPDEVFPLDKVAPGERVTIRYSSGMDGPEFFNLTLTWKDPAGRQSTLTRRLEV